MSKYILLTKHPTSQEWRIDTAYDDYAELRQGVLDFASDFEDANGILPQYGEDYRTMLEHPVDAENLIQADRDQAAWDMQPDEPQWREGQVWPVTGEQEFNLNP